MKKMTSIRNIDSPYFKVKAGTFDKKDPKVIFLEGSTYITPYEDIEYSSAIYKLKNIVNREIKEILFENIDFYDDFIEIVETPSERMKTGKKSYLYFECHFKQKGEKNFEDIMKSLDEINGPVIESFCKNIANLGFKIDKNK